MNWQYRPILFEFRKDGLLGDRYIDDDEMEEVLNDHGRKGWELVSVTPVQEGLLSFFKRALPQKGRQPPVQPSGPAKISAERKTELKKPNVHKQVHPVNVSSSSAEGKVKTPKKQPEEIGEIKIS